MTQSILTTEPITGLEAINVNELVERSPDDKVLIAALLSGIRHVMECGVSVDQVADYLEVRVATVKLWLDDKTVPNHPKWPGHRVKDYMLRFITNCPEIQDYMIAGIKKPLLVTIPMQKPVNGEETEAFQLFKDIPRTKLTVNFVAVLDKILDESQHSQVAYQNLADILDVHITTIKNWLAGKFSPHNTKRPNQTIYHHIDKLRAVYKNRFDGWLRRTVIIPLPDELPKLVEKHKPVILEEVPQPIPITRLEGGKIDPNLSIKQVIDMLEQAIVMVDTQLSEYLGQWEDIERIVTDLEKQGTMYKKKRDLLLEAISEEEKQ